MYKLLVLLLCTSVLSYRPACNKKSIRGYLREKTYDFSVRLLDRVAEETKGNFVFSPISTWLQLLLLSEGAQGPTLAEIQNLTGQDNRVCFKQITKEIFNTLDDELGQTIKHQNILVIDQLLNVKPAFITKVETLKAAKVMTVNFGRANDSASKVNKIIKSVTNGLIPEGMEADDFNNTVVLIADVLTMKANWLSPFNRAFTEYEMFYSTEKVPVGNVKMMRQIGSFNYVNSIQGINARALELPFSDRASMILLLPNVGRADDLFWSLKQIRVASILNLLKSNGPKLVNVRMPRFNITTEVDNVPELLHDMGLRRVFLPRIANFRGISDYRVFVSMMKHKANIEVSETGVKANFSPELLARQEDSIDVAFNRPFAYLVIDKISNVILFGGVYLRPNVF